MRVLAQNGFMNFPRELGVFLSIERTLYLGLVAFSMSVTSNSCRQGHAPFSAGHILDQGLDWEDRLIVSLGRA